MSTKLSGEERRKIQIAEKRKEKQAKAEADKIILGSLSDERLKQINRGIKFDAIVCLGVTVFTVILVLGFALPATIAVHVLTPNAIIATVVVSLVLGSLVGIYSIGIAKAFVEHGFYHNEMVRRKLSIK